MNKLNLGCGHITINGYINIDSGWNVLFSKIPWIKKPLYKLGIFPEGMLYDLDKSIIRMNLPSGLRKFKDNSADRIFTSHFIEHVTPKDSTFTLRECFRILCPNGLIRIVLPDALLWAKAYVANTEACIRDNQSSEEHRNTMFHSVAGGYQTGHKNSHRFMWDIPSMKYNLEKIGFQQITVCSYRSGKDPEMYNADNYPDASFFIEAVKP